ncbi:hypothetical protein RRG08_057601 [Elysia crispata]|uniref:Lipocalin/cytosolic fatty-acid binding domain-containing protein n=1 Tax=Elysia crispata TaxID=231223 RepID=A0AAE0ZBZ4_9GAST|nr:hypothetical protein RRG08_057601 [Elysia crispata]
MNTWFVLAALTWFGGSLAQLPCTLESFVAEAFDVFNFTFLHSYHDVSTMVTLYETPAGESVYLFDFNEGKLYVNRPNSTCVQYENPDSKISPAALGLAQEKLQFTNPMGVNLRGFEYTNGGATTRIFLSDTCDSYFISFLVNNQNRLAFSFYNQRDFTDDDAQKVEDAKATFEAANCAVGLM